MTQVLPAALVAPTKPGLTVGYLIRANSGTVSTAFTTSGVSEQGTSTGYYRVNNGISAPDDGGLLEWYVNNAGAAGTFLSAVAIDPAPNQADQAAGIRAAVGLASANLDSQLGNINSKTTNLPASFPTVDGSGRVTVGTNADKTGYSLASSQTFSTTGAVGSVTGAVNSVTNPVTLANNSITAAVIATDAIDADALAASAVTEIQSGLASQASVDAKASQASVDALSSKADDITALVL